MAQMMLKQGPGNLRCTLTCWGAGLAVGAGATVVARILAAIEWNGAVFIGALVFIAAGGLMSFLFCRPLPTLADVEARRAAKGAGASATPGTTTPAAAAPAATTPAAAAPVSAPPVAPRADAPPRAEAEAPAAAAPASAPPASAPPAAAPLAAAPVAPEAAPAPAAAPPQADSAAPGPGDADDLTRLQGVGPVLSAALNAEGIYRFEQIAAWSPAEAARFDAAVAGGRGRVMRDDWVGQARALASGGH